MKKIQKDSGIASFLTRCELLILSLYHFATYIYNGFTFMLVIYVHGTSVSRIYVIVYCVSMRSTNSTHIY